MAPQLVIFDCDGVLVDSERIANRVLSECLVELGFELGFDETVKAFMGRSSKDCLALIAEQLERPVPAEFMSRCTMRTLAQFEQALQPIPGVAEALQLIDLPRCVASSSERTWIGKALALTGLLDQFEGRIFSGAELARGKPHPDIFFHAAHTLGIDPARCTVVEDSVPGVRAGVAAGMTVLGYADLTPEAELSEAGAATFTSMSQLPGLIG